MNNKKHLHYNFSDLHHLLVVELLIQEELRKSRKLLKEKIQLLDSKTKLKIKMLLN